MGSLEEAMFVGFICRLCSYPKRTVVFIFGVRGRQLDLLNKINSYLPIQVSEDDDLPKTICEACLVKILQHHQLIERIQQVQKRFLMMRNENGTPLITIEPPPIVAALAPESARSSRTLSVDSAEPVEEPTQDPTAGSRNTQQTTAASAEAPAASSGMPSTQSNAINDGASTLPRSSNSQQTTVTSAEAPAASSGVPSTLSNAINDGAPTHPHSSNMQQTTAASAEAPAASSGVPSTLSNAINDGASTSRRRAVVSAVDRMGRVRKRRRQFRRMVKTIRKRFRRTPPE